MSIFFLLDIIFIVKSKIACPLLCFPCFSVYCLYCFAPSVFSFLFFNQGFKTGRCFQKYISITAEFDVSLPLSLSSRVMSILASKGFLNPLRTFSFFRAQI